MIENMFNSKVNVVAVSRASDDYGSQVESDVVVHHDLPCRINWSRGSEKIMFGKDTWYRDGKLYCRASANITPEMRIVYKSTTYEIVNVSNPDNMDKYLIVDIKLIQ